MALFEKKTVLFSEKQLSVGEFDPTKPGCYDNVKTFPIALKPRKALYYSFKSNIPTSIVFANSDNSSVYHKEDQTEIEDGPIPTGNNKEMGLILGVYPGDKAKVDIEIWMEKA